MKEGDKLTHTDIEKLIGVNREREQTRYGGIVAAARQRVLKELGVYLESVRGVGYVYPFGRTQLFRAGRLIRAGYRQHGRAAAVAAMVHDDRLPNPEDRKLRDTIVERVKPLYDQAVLESHTLQLLLGKPEVAPQMTER